MAIPSETKPRRPSQVRRFTQFSLRGLLLLIAICAVWLGIVFHRAREQARIVALIQAKYSNFVLYDFHEVEPDSVDPDATSPHAAWLLDTFGVDFFHNVTRAWLFEATNDELAELCRLRTIRGLTLDRPSISNDRLNDLNKLSELWRLDISSPELDSRSLEDLLKLHNLRRMDIALPKITDEDLDLFKHSSNLRTLVFEDTQITRAGVAELGKSLPNCTIYLYRDDREFVIGPEAPPMSKDEVE